MLNPDALDGILIDNAQKILDNDRLIGRIAK